MQVFTLFVSQHQTHYLKGGAVAWGALSALPLCPPGLEAEAAEHNGRAQARTFVWAPRAVTPIAHVAVLFPNGPSLAALRTPAIPEWRA